MSNEFQESNKKRIAEMTRAEKWQYFKDYYLKRVIAIAALALVVIYILSRIFGPRDTNVLRVIVFDDYLTTDGTENLETEVRALLNAEDAHEIVDIQDGYYSSDQNDLASLGILSTSKEIDAVVAPREAFEEFASYGYFLPLDSVFDKEFLSAHNDSIVSCAGYRHPDNGTDGLADEGKGEGEVLAYGIELSGSGKWMNISTNCEDPVIGVIVESEVPQNAVKFTEFLFS